MRKGEEGRGVERQRTSGSGGGGCIFAGTLECALQEVASWQWILCANVGEKDLLN